LVSNGDSLWSISRRYGVDVRSLASWNAMAPGDVLSVGRELVLWMPGQAEASRVTATAQQTTAGPPAAAAPQPEPATRVAAAAGNDQVRQVTYVVRRGDSLYSIAQRFRVTIANLTEWNRVSTSKYLQPGQRLVMYVNVLEQST
jgi:membrane-bound lytic murein transglycosylase D